MCYCMFYFTCDCSFRRTVKNSQREHNDSSGIIQHRTKKRQTVYKFGRKVRRISQLFIQISRILIRLHCTFVFVNHLSAVFCLFIAYTVSRKKANNILHRVSKKLCQLIFCSFSVKYEPISIKIGRIVPEEKLHKTVPRMPTSPKVCACITLGNLKCQIEPSTQQLNVHLI